MKVSMLPTCSTPVCTLAGLHSLLRGCPQSWNHAAHQAHAVNSAALCREMEKEAALVQKVSASFGRRDFLRRHMDKIEAMIADSGASASTQPADC